MGRTAERRRHAVPAGVEDRSAVRPIFDGRIAGEAAVFDSQGPEVYDRSAGIACSIGQEGTAVDVAGCISVDGASNLRRVFAPNN